MVGSKITTSGQATIPKKIRERLNLQVGDRVLFIEKDGDVVMQPVTQTLRDLKGSIESHKQPLNSLLIAFSKHDRLHLYL